MYVASPVPTTLLFAIATTLVLLSIENRSHVPSGLAIPILVALLTKYVLGDWDPGFHWTALDIPYWISILGVSYGTVLFWHTSRP